MADSETDSAPEETGPIPAAWRNRLAWVAAVISFAVLLPVYYQTCMKRAAIWNTDARLEEKMAGGEISHVIFHHDQHVYLNLGRLLRINHYDYTIPRMRVPGYPLLLSLLFPGEDFNYQPGPEDDPDRRVSDAYFARGRHFNIILSMVTIVALFCFSKIWLPVTESLLITWSVAFLLFVFRAPFVQPEVLFTVLNLFVVVLLWHQLADPTWKRGILTGALMALTYFVKSALLPLLALFVLCYALRMLLQFRPLRKIPLKQWKREFEWKPWFLETARGAIIPVTFVTLLSPYLLNTWKIYGSPFWSAHAKHYFWLETPEEKNKWRGIALIENQPVPDDVPTMTSYLSSHSAGEIANRFLSGAAHHLDLIRQQYEAVHRFVFKRLGRVCLIIGLIFLIPVWKSTRRHWIELLFLTGTLVGYSLLYGWWDQIRAGLRMILSMLPIAVFLAIWFLRRFADREITVPRLRWKLNLRYLVNAVLALCLATAITRVLQSDAWEVEGGS